MSDNVIFIVSTPENAVNYPNEKFYPVDEEAIKAYEIEVRDGRIVSDLFPKVRL